jgi:hypothetical protein
MRTLKTLALAGGLVLGAAACSPLSIHGTWVKTPPAQTSQVEDDPNWDCLNSGNGLCGPLKAQVNCSTGWVKVYDRFGTQVMNLAPAQVEVLPTGYMVLEDTDGDAPYGGTQLDGFLGTVFPGNYNAC